MRSAAVRELPVSTATRCVHVSPVIDRLAVLVRRAARHDVTVLVTGESGTGKEVLSRALVDASPRAGQRFVRFNCAALPATLAEAELFGHVRGAFSGAVSDRAGLFREADGGTVLLDEIGELDLGMQAKLLRVLQEHEVRPVGQDAAERVDVRVIAATNRDLAREVAEGRFREDLYFRLKVVELTVPPLRDRPEDIPVLARHFVAETAARLGVPPPPLGPELLARLQAYRWPGNVRELQHALEAAMVLSDEGALEPALLPGGVAPAAPAAAAAPAASGGAPTACGSFHERMDRYARVLLQEALEAAGGNLADAARRLGVARATLYDLLRRHGIARPGAALTAGAR